MYDAPVAEMIMNVDAVASSNILDRWETPIDPE